ncbi:extracellular solute-binding protein [Cyanobium gracile UHCC 0139]|uniref:Extracellular solute-binding protein n=1 Tax=Cyanobium gracile UHCC 0139 TaxID=3110308 RepID=A0ABU5RS74_9CYAN|nr:extracellular solute-binding protein [Cyanobium gracile]MEA5390632.1 extracellular solute-binding protein [Cyanobium gracile UHCC 0139]
MAWRPPFSIRRWWRSLPRLLSAGVLAFLSAAMLLVLLPGSGPSGSALSVSGPSGIPLGAAGPVPVRVLMPAPLADAVAAPVAQFNASGAGVSLEVIRGPLDTDTISDLAIGSLLLGEAPFDLLLVDVSWLARYVAAGWFEPLDRWFGPEVLAAMEPGARLGNGLDGHLWRMPLTGDTGLLYWRTDLMARPPRDTEELVAISRDLQRRGRVRWGYLWQGRQYEGLSCVMVEVLHGFGAHWWNSSTARTELDSPEAVAAAKWLAALLRDGVSPAAVASYAENDTLQSFAAGEAAFLRNWPYAWREIEKGEGPVKGKVGVTPMVGAPGEQGGGTLGTWGLSLIKGSPHPEEAVAAIRWLTGPEVQRQLAIEQGYAPTWSRLYDDPDLQHRAPLLAVQRQALQHPQLRPPTPAYAQLSDLLARQVNGMLTGQGDPGPTMADAQRMSLQLLRSVAGPASDTAEDRPAVGR